VLVTAHSADLTATYFKEARFLPAPAHCGAQRPDSPKPSLHPPSVPAEWPATLHPWSAMRKSERSEVGVNEGWAGGTVGGSYPTSGGSVSGRSRVCGGVGFGSFACVGPTVGIMVGLQARRVFEANLDRFDAWLAAGGGAGGDDEAPPPMATPVCKASGY
jgi:hypothetical protein